MADGDALVAFGLLTFTFLAVALAPGHVRAAWWAALIRRSP